MALCRVCLVGNIRLLNLSNIHLAAYQKLTDNEPNIKTEFDMPSTVCYVCHRQLQRFHMFSEMARKTNRILQDLLHNGIEVTHNALIVQPLNVLNLTLASTVHWSLGDTETASSTPVAVKDEPKIESNEEETLCVETTSSTPVAVKYEPKIESNEEETLSVLNLTLASTVHWSSGDTETTSSTPVAVKYEPKIESNEEETLECEEYNLEVSKLEPLEDKDVNDDFNKTVLESDNNVNADMNNMLHSCFNCDLCDRIFYQKGDVVKHLKFHTKKTPYCCNRCNKSFTQKCNLNLHMRIHTGEKPYSCSRCDKTFSRKSTLNLHMRIHTGEKPYTCNRCNKKFNQKHHLTRHVQIHMAEKPPATDVI